MALIQTKEKTAIQLNLRITEKQQANIDDTFKKALQVQPDIKKAELIRDAIERGLTEIEQQLKAVDKV